jgi:hypothetical protein
MERELQIGRQKIRFDREATVSLYRDTITVPNADRCTCISCKNFATQRTRVYPAVFLALLEELGVNALMEWKVFDYDFEQNTEGHLYGGWFLFCGELIEGAEERPDSEKPGFAYWFTTFFPGGNLPKDTKRCAVEFLTRIPWVFPAPPE